MLDSSRIAELLSKEDLIFLDGWGETPYVLDKFGRQSLPIKVPSHEEELTVSDIKNQLGTPKSPVRFAIQLNAVDEVFNSAEASDVFATLVARITEKIRVTCKIHFGTEDANYPTILSRIIELRGLPHVRQRCRFILSGPFGEGIVSFLETMMQNSIQLEFAAGWWRDCPPTEYARLKCEVVREISEFGYRLPVLWYVHEQNVNHIPELISESLQANYDSGFKLSMVSSNPYYNFDPLDPPVPISDAYCDLLIQCFENYRQYDGILEPYAELLEVVLRGGWHSSLNTPPMINLLLRPNVPIGLHLHIPHRAVSWLELSEIKDMSCDAILNNLVKHYQTMFDLRENTFCQRCSWRYVCGGIDANTDQSLLVEKARTAICDHRLFLLQFLTYLRINNSLTSSDLAKRMNR